MPAEEVSQLILAEAQRQLGNQEDALNNLRLTAGAVITGASIVAAVFGAVATAETHRSGGSIFAEVVALALFSGTIYAAVVMLRPREWHSQHELATWINRLRTPEAAPTVLTVTTNFANYLNDFRKQNNPVLKYLQFWLTAACILLALQVAAWALAVL